MARSSSLSLPRRPLRLAAGAALALAIAALVALLITAIAGAAGDPQGRPARVDIAHLVRMTGIQAGLSTVLSLAVGTLLAWALNRLRFPGRDLLVGLFASAIVTPGIVVAFGLLAVWGRAGWLSAGSRALFGVPLDVPIFGLGGILAAHVILNGAFAARLLLSRLEAIPDTRLKTGQSLGLGPWRRFVVIDWPAIRGTLPGLAAIVFLLAFTSFPIVLLLGGGPANQTLEVAIYSAVRLDFDLDAAVMLALTQIGVCALIIIAASAFAPVPTALSEGSVRLWRDRPAIRAWQWAIVALGAIGFALPLGAVLVDGFAVGMPQLLGRASFWSAAWTSTWIGGASAVLTVLAAFGLAAARAASAGAFARLLISLPAYAYLAVPAVVLALGFFLLVRGLGAAPAAAGPVVVVLANGLLALPFAIAALGPPLEAIAGDRGRLIRSLGLSGWQQIALVEWPLVARETGVAFTLAFCLSLGDLGVIALFGTQDFATLPLAMFRALGAYRTNDAAAIAALMLATTIAVFVLMPRLAGRLGRAVA